MSLSTQYKHTRKRKMDPKQKSYVHNVFKPLTEKIKRKKKD